MNSEINKVVVFVW